MLKRSKDLLRAIVGPMRNTLAGTAQADGTWQRGDLDRELERLGIAPDGSLTPLDALPNASAAERRARYAADAAISTAVNGAKGAEAERKRAAAREEVIERAAYTWINRLLALRTMEARGLIDETLRNNPDYDGVSEALFILRSDAPARTASNDGGWWAVIEDECKAQAQALPGLFDLSDPAAALRPSTAALLRCVSLVSGAPSGFTLAEADAAFADPDAIGWAYQFYQEAAKARVYAKLGSGGKAASRAEIAAATQLFTEPYMVQWLLQNSLGRSYHEAYPDSELPETWAYYIRQRPEGQEPPESPRPLHALDLIDPCCGSGHFLREAFDMFAAMYHEQHPELSADEIANRVLARHLHGIDLDPRAAQLAALTLYLRAWEFVRKDARQRRQSSPSVVYRPSSLNIASTPSGLSEGSLQRHLRRHPEDRVMKPLLDHVFAALEQADILGSLLRPAEHIDMAIRALQQPHTVQMDFDADDAALRRTITALANSDPTELKRMLMERVAQSFRAEAGEADDVAAQLFGREAEGGVRLLQLLDRKYAVVVTNPPYMGSGNMDVPLKRYIERHYKPGKRDIYAAFILRCLELARYGGRVAMITQQSWMFLRSFAELRAMPEEKLAEARRKHEYTGMLRESTIAGLAHLGPNAFEEISGEVVQNAMFVLANAMPHADHCMAAIRLVGLKSGPEKAHVLRDRDTRSISTPKQSDFLALPESPLAYWLRPKFFELLTGKTLNKIGSIKQGLATAEDSHFVRFFWEVSLHSQRWFRYYKGGGYKRWDGFGQYCVDWENEGRRVKARIDPKTGRPYSNVWMLQRTEHELFFKVGLTASLMAQGSFATRVMYESGIFSSASPCIFVAYEKTNLTAALLNCRLISYLLRALSPELKFREGYVARVPVTDNENELVANLANNCLSLKRRLVDTNTVEPNFTGAVIAQRNLEAIAAVLHTLEGINEREVFAAYGVDGADMQAVLDETGTPAGWFPLVQGYDALPETPHPSPLPPGEGAGLPSPDGRGAGGEGLPPEVLDYLAAHERITPTPAKLGQIKARLRALYEQGPGIRGQESDDDEVTTDNGQLTTDDEPVSGAYIPIPTETFPEELSVKMQLHPISVYWLLEELRGEGARCKPEERRLLEDRLSVTVLRLLGHRWPKQIEAGENVPTWADPDGIIPISGSAGEQTLTERVRARLRDEDGDLGAQRAEALLQELTGQSLEEWLRREFFKRHMRQFKYRPIAWHLASDPSVAVPDAKAKKRLGGRRPPAFECIVYYHACGGDVLARIRTQYVEPLLRGARQQLEQANRAKDENGAVQATMRIQELEEFNRRLQRVAERGFASPEVEKVVADEPLDRWSGDGYLAPTDREDLQRQEQGWRVDLNDGVRVNIAPVQFAGLLVSDVLKAVDAKKAIADRTRWRSDERRWVRVGKLPRCGWMDERVPESPEWARLAPQREAERAKLEEKRAKLASEH